jgi:hypothetical protein
MLNEDENYKCCLPISDRKTDEQYRVELLLRLLISQTIDWKIIGDYSDFSELLDKETVKLCEKKVDKEVESRKFKTTFQLLYGLFGEDTFKKYNGEKRLGPVMASVFQAVAPGVFKNIDNIVSLPNREEWLTDRINSVFDTDEFKRNIVPGVRSIPRFKDLSLFSMGYFKV